MILAWKCINELTFDCLFSNFRLRSLRHMLHICFTFSFVVFWSIKDSASIRGAWNVYSLIENNRKVLHWKICVRLRYEIIGMAGNGNNMSSGVRFYATFQLQRIRLEWICMNIKFRSYMVVGIRKNYYLYSQIFSKFSQK